LVILIKIILPLTTAKLVPFFCLASNMGLSALFVVTVD